MHHYFKKTYPVFLTLIIAGVSSNSVFAQDDVSVSGVNKTVESWPSRPKLAVQSMMAKYGEPLEVSSESIIWHNEGPYKRIMVTKKEIPHDFPKPHMDFLEHTILYNVPTNKVSDLVEFDASMTVNKTAGEMSARCDLEGHNVLTLNLAKDIIDGKKTVAQARKSFADNVIADVAGQRPEYVENLVFEPHAMEKAAFADKPNIPGSPVRSIASEGESKDKKEMGDAEVLAFVIAADDNEVLSAAEAQKKEISKEVKDYAKMIQETHGKNQSKVMSLGKKLKTVPSDTVAVDDLRQKGAEGLAKLIPLNGKEFEKAYVEAKVKAHQEVLSMIDDKLIPAAKNAELKTQLADTRKHVVAHLDMATKLQQKL